MADLFASGRIVDLVIFFALVEGVALAIIVKRTGRGPGPAEIISILMPGLLLMAALRAALVGASWVWIAGWLLLALVAHLGDLARRLRRG